MTPDASSCRSRDARAARVVAFFEAMRREDLPRLGQIYAPNAHFKDPFNDVVGIEAVTRAYGHMYEKLEAPRFVVHDAMAEAEVCFLTWDLLFRFKGESRERTIHGATRIRFDPAGLIEDHRDYWDAAEELYEKLPLLGSFMRWLKRRAAS